MAMNLYKLHTAPAQLYGSDKIQHQVSGGNPARMLHETFMCGDLHSVNDHPAKWVEPDTDAYAQAWYKHGVLHRDGGPAYITPTAEVWYQDGVYHNDDGPAKISVVSDQSEWSWWTRGKLNRDDDLPARITKGLNWVQFSWYRNDRLHRDGGEPAVVKIGPFGEENQYRWFVDDMRVGVERADWAGGISRPDWKFTDRTLRGCDEFL